MNLVKIDSGYVAGTVLGNPDKRISAFRGIPYAAPPVGNLRWQPPQPVAPWAGIRECTAFSLAAPQTAFLGMSFSGVRQSEDCLYLNVMTPAAKANARLPVMVWMHGGGYLAGSGNDTCYQRLGLPSQGVVLASVNTRLGPLGLLAHPLLSRGSPYGVSGNYLFLDMIAALKWVQRNIAAFGGDPGNVTIFGESGGSEKVTNLLASPLASGLFRRAIGESGAGKGTPLHEMEARGERVMAKLGVDKADDPLAAARAVPWQKVIEAGQQVVQELKAPMGLWDSAVDRWFLPDTVAGAFAAGRQNAVPFIMGANLGELTGPGMIMMPHLISSYVGMFGSAVKIGGKAYGYVFDHVPAGWKRDGVVCGHIMEVPYVFGQLDYKDALWKTLFALARPFGAKSPDPGLGDADRVVSDVMMKMWTNFARTGDPGVDGFDWPTWDQAQDRYLYITGKPEVRSGFSKVGQK